MALTTIMPDEQPQITPIWCNLDRDYVLINTMRGFRKEKNMRENPKVTLLTNNPKQPLHSIEIRGIVIEMTEEGAEVHADKLTQLYTSKQRFYGDIYPVEQKQKETRVIVKIEPLKISRDAIFK